jgi:hypothetical protein
LGRLSRVEVRRGIFFQGTSPSGFYCASFNGSRSPFGFSDGQLAAAHFHYIDHRDTPGFLWVRNLVAGTPSGKGFNGQGSIVSRELKT